MLSFAIPGTVIGVSYILAFNVPPIEITGTALDHRDLLRLPQHAGRRARRHRGDEPDRQSLDEASVTLARLAVRDAARVVLPLLRPAIVDRAGLQLRARHDDGVSAVIFLVSAQYELATIYIINRAINGDYGVAIAYSPRADRADAGRDRLIQSPSANAARPSRRRRRAAGLASDDTGSTCMTAHPASGTRAAEVQLRTSPSATAT